METFIKTIKSTLLLHFSSAHRLHQRQQLPNNTTVIFSHFPKNSKIPNQKGKAKPTAPNFPNPKKPKKTLPQNCLLGTTSAGSKMITSLCEEGDDGNYGSTAVQDVHVLQTMSTRIYYGLFVAESKFRSEREKAMDAKAARKEKKD